MRGYQKKFPKNLHNVIKIMLWKFFLQHQKHHVMENHAMEIHVRRGPTALWEKELQNRKNLSVK